MIPLTVRSHYSLMWGTASPEQLCAAARTLGYPALAITDGDNLYGLFSFLAAAERHCVRPIVGAELTQPGSGLRVIALCEDETGYQNLCQLITRRRCDEGFSLVQGLSELGAGLSVLAMDPDLLARCREAGVHAAVPMPRRPSTMSPTVRRLARRLDLDLVATPGSFFLRPEDHELHRVLRAIALRTTLPRLDPKAAAPADAYLASPEAYRERFAILPEALRAASALGERCAFRGPSRSLVLPPWDDPAGRTAAQGLREAAYEGAVRRYGEDLSEAVVERLEHELRLIDQMGFSSYFLVVREIVERSPRICGRGSGAASLVAYALGITNVCPIKHNLYFERFLNPGRKDPPDIDVDFAWDERDEVLAWVLGRHRGRAAMVSNHVFFQPRLAIREVGRVFGLPVGEIDEVVRHLPLMWHEDLPEDEPRLRRAGTEAAAQGTVPAGEPWPTVLRLAEALVGTPRHLSVHVGGVVITPGPLDRHAPLEIAPKGVPIVQWEKDGTEESGLVKIDLLGNRSLGVIRDAMRNVKDNGVVFDEERWDPEDDPETQRAVARGLTMGCFYIESPAMRLLQQKTGKGDFEHLVIHSSIIRPAANEFIREYVRRLHGGAWLPIHPLLADVLDETYGIMVYQEDVSRTAVALAGFSHAEADGLRKILSKKDRELKLGDYRARFFAGAEARGVDPLSTQAVWAMMMSFDGYSFCKPHSASYARVSFQAAYLKVHFPAEFMAAVISNQGGFYSTFAYVSEARRLGLTVLPPDVNRSEGRWRGQGQTLRVGLMSVKALSQRTLERLLTLRQRGPFRDLDDFIVRVSPDEREARALIHAGACDGLGPGAGSFGAESCETDATRARGALRATLLWRFLRARRGQSRKAEGGELFSGPMPVADPELPSPDPRAALRREFEALGFLCDRHPMTLYPSLQKGRSLVKARDLPAYVGRRVRLAAWLIAGKLVPTRKGEPMEFLTFEDETGLAETTFFPEAYRRFCNRLTYNRPFMLSGKVEEDFGACTLTVDQATRVGPSESERRPAAQTK